MALPPEIRKRLQELNKGPLTFKNKPQQEESASKDSIQNDSARNPSAAPKLPEAVQPQGPITLEDAAPGEVAETPFGSFYLIRKTFSQMMPDAGSFLRNYDEVFNGGSMAWREGSLHPDLQPVLSISPDRVLFMDIETTGLFANPLFLIGIMYYRDGELHLEQLFARDYSEEQAVIAYFVDKLLRHEILITYNGKSFDMPFIADRGIATQVEVAFVGHHLDLLHEARRRWRGRLPNCKLQTLERFFCNRVRVGDIPGDMIPQAYHDFVHTGDAVQIRDILHHNALDLIAMAEVLHHMVAGDEQ